MSGWRLRGRLVSRSARPGRAQRPAERPAPARPRLEVWKLGGASLADANAVRRAVGLVQRHPGDLVVVVSALKDVTDGLLEGAHRSVSGDVAAASAQAAAFLRRHRALVLDLVAPGPDRRRLLSEANRAAREWRRRSSPRRSPRPAARRRGWTRSTSWPPTAIMGRRPPTWRKRGGAR